MFGRFSRYARFEQRRAELAPLVSEAVAGVLVEATARLALGVEEDVPARAIEGLATRSARGTFDDDRASAREHRRRAERSGDLDRVRHDALSSGGKSEPAAVRPREHDRAAGLALARDRGDEEVAPEQKRVVDRAEPRIGRIGEEERARDGKTARARFTEQGVEMGQEAHAPLERCAHVRLRARSERPGLLATGALLAVATAEREVRAELEPAHEELLGRIAEEATEIGAAERLPGETQVQHHRDRLHGG
jgi:hypothetical protein